MSQLVKCAIIDDEPLAIEVIKDYIEQVPQLELVMTSTDPMEAFQMINEHNIDLLFLDIEMPKMSGIDFIKSLDISAHVILTTAYRKYAVDSYEIDVVDYLLKPISFSRFVKAINKYLKIATNSVTPEIQHASTVGGGSIYVYADKKNVKVNFDEILFIESIKDYVRIHTTKKNIVSKNTITRYEEMLPDSFLRIHRSYIVNTAKLTAFTHQDVEIGDKELPIGKSYKNKVLGQLKG